MSEVVGTLFLGKHMSKSILIEWSHVNQHGLELDPMFHWAWSGSKLFAKISTDDEIYR